MRKLSMYVGLILLIMIVIAVPVMAEGNSIKIFLKGKPLFMEIDPIIENGRVLIPIRFISEELEFDIEYINESKVVKINKNDKDIEIMIGSDKAKVDGKEVKLEVKSFIKGNRTFIPLEFIYEAFSEEVIWNKNNKIVLIGEYGSEAKMDNTILYTNEEYGYTLNFPVSWNEEAVIQTKNGILYVYDRKTAEKFKENGVYNCGPVFEIRCSDYPVIATVPYDTNYILYYADGKYIETIFDLDFQYYPETRDSYMKIWNEGQEALGTFKKLEDIILADKEIYKEEVKVLYDIVDNFVPKNIFNKDEIYTLRKSDSHNNLLYMRIMKDEEETLIKLESTFDENSKLIQYRFKSYGYDVKENKLTQDEALKLANRFINKYVDNDIELTKIPDIYPSLYEENKHETYGDKDEKHIVVVDLEHGFIEYYE